MTYHSPAFVAGLLLLPTMLLLTGCSAAGPVTISGWRNQVQRYIEEQGSGDASVLRNVSWPQSRRSFSSLGGEDPGASQDGNGLLLGFRQIGGKQWFIFIVGIVEKGVVDDIRIAALNANDGRYTWRTSRADKEALETYRGFYERLWKQRFPGRETPAPQYTTFPQEADVFDIAVAGGRIVVTHPQSKARWELVVDPKINAASAAQPAMAPAR